MRFLLIYTILICSLILDAQPPAALGVSQGSFKLSGLSDDNQYFGFAEGDQITFSFKEERGKNIQEMEVIEYPNTSRFSEFKFSKVNHTLMIPKTGIYCFKLSNGAIGGRTVRYKISRLPASSETISFNTTVSWKTHHDTTWLESVETYLTRDELVPQVIVSSSDFYINSGSNALLLGGTSRITVPLNFPPNAVKWFYEFSASREESDIKQVQESYGLMGQLVASIEPTMAAANIGMNLLATPPGANQCDIFLLNHDNRKKFESKTPFSYYMDGSRDNMKSGLVEIPWVPKEQLYIGIRNPSSSHGIHVTVEVVAIVHEQEYAERSITLPKVNTYKIPYLHN